MSPLKIVFAGTPDFAATSLQAVLDSPHQVVAVLTQPDRPAGRGKKLAASPVKQLALAHDLPVLQPQTLKDHEILKALERLNPDVMVVVAYGLLVPPKVLSLPKYGCINVHGSLLPRWRGAAPIQRAIEAGDTETGVGIMQMEKGLDTGPVLLEKRTPISPGDTGGEIHDRLASLGSQALVEALADLPRWQASARAQPEEGVCYAHKLGREDAEIDWRQPAVVLANKVRAFNPWPVTWAGWQQQPLKIWAASVAGGQGAPGEILAVGSDGVEVACGEGSLLLTQVQLPGKKALSVADLLRGRADLFKRGEKFEPRG